MDNLLLQRLLRDERGATVVEYGLIVAMIFLAIVGALTGLASENKLLWSNMSDEMVTASKQANSI